LLLQHPDLPILQVPLEARDAIGPRWPERFWPGPACKSPNICWLALLPSDQPPPAAGKPADCHANRRPLAIHAQSSGDNGALNEDARVSPASLRSGSGGACPGFHAGGRHVASPSPLRAETGGVMPEAPTGGPQPEQTQPGWKPSGLCEPATPGFLLAGER